ncbi:MAG: sensor histidine kinase [Planctomycetaceae bacterium]
MPVDASLDVQERERLQARYAEIATLAGGLAHEIRNPLSTISLNLDLIVEDLQDADAPRDQRILRKIQTVKRECGRLEGVLSAFLQFARVGELELVETGLNDVVREFIDFYRPQAEEHAIEIRPHLCADLPRVRLDEPLIRQVLMNLALNAQQAMPGGGLLEVQTFVRDGSVHLELIDTGGGMDEHVRCRAFQAFFSTRPAGSGLGLPTVRKIIEAHGGEIHCDSEPARGTRFTIVLPAA